MSSPIRPCRSTGATTAGAGRDSVIASPEEGRVARSSASASPEDDATLEPASGVPTNHNGATSPRTLLRQQAVQLFLDGDIVGAARLLGHQSPPPSYYRRSVVLFDQSRRKPARTTTKGT